ncbi:Adipogenesis regulatory factor [Sciurus carolinensis]|uniref:Adipogenesis regulatory factor n=1 Tax=Sciurus carolinensis TaxID=30640 RepID=A0AA41MY34_SCICA|nr:Adipogenesis regulatory factor [Sciurus carolinensis]
MASKGFKDLKQQAEGTAQDAAMDNLGKSTQEAIDKAANQASDSVSGLGKKFGLQK